MTQSFLDYLNQSGGVQYDTNSGVNMTAAQATSPVITDNNGTSSASPGVLSFLGSLVSTAGQVFTATNAQNTQNRIAQANAPATVATAQSNTFMYLALGGVAILVAVLLFLRRK